MELVTIKPYKGDTYGSWKLPASVESTKDNRISACFDRGTLDTLRGLSKEEEIKFLPNIVGLSPSSPNWESATREYWSNMSIIVPPKGLILNKGLRADGTPENLNQYIYFRFIERHPDVAKNEKSVEWPNHKFFIVDEKIVAKEQEAQFKLRNAANKEFLLLQNEKNASKLEWVARCIKEKEDVVDFSSNEKMLMYIEGKKDSSLSDFLSIVQDPDLEQKALLNKLVEAHIVDIQGNSYFYEGEIMGVLAEAIAWIKNPVNSKSVLHIQEKLKAVAV